MASTAHLEENAAPAASTAAGGRRPVAGALVVGGDHPGLGVVRSLGRRGIPVYVLEDQPCISAVSRYATKVVRVPNILDERMTVDAVLETGRRYNLRDWVLIPTRDETVAAFSRYRQELAGFFRVTTVPWDSAVWAWHKRKTYELAESLGIPCPKTFTVRSAEELPSLYPHLPLALKPAVKENFFYATGAKAWRADTVEQLNAHFERAARHIPPDEILIQEIVPGDGRSQYSYCAFARDGRPLCVLTALRLRQHPREFGRAATYVETVDAPEVEYLSERFLRAIRYHGIVEIEYKRDARTGEYKLLDVNARTWGFHALGAACAVDFPWILYADQMGWPVEPARARPGVGWIRLLTDIPTALSDIASGRLTIRGYLRSLRAARVEPVFSWSDPLPAMLEILLAPYFILRKYPHLTKRPGRNGAD